MGKVRRQVSPDQVVSEHNLERECCLSAREDKEKIRPQEVSGSQIEMNVVEKLGVIIKLVLYTTPFHWPLPSFSKL